LKKVRAVELNRAVVRQKAHSKSLLNGSYISSRATAAAGGAAAAAAAAHILNLLFK
jgi:hypothetical protein